jgi:hypothetical protein
LPFKNSVRNIDNAAHYVNNISVNNEEQKELELMQESALNLINPSNDLNDRRIADEVHVIQLLESGR